MIFKLVVLFVSSAFAFLPNNPLTPMLGWSSWNTFRAMINESCIKQAAIAMKSNGMKEAGYRYINIDDGFFAHRNSHGDFRYDKLKFPSGMKAMADFIHELGLNAGIYSDAGDDTCGSLYDNQKGFGVGLYKHEEADANLFFSEWGFDFIKVDFCGGLHARLNAKKQYSKIHEAIQKTKPPNKIIRFNLCRWTFPGTWAANVAESWRMSADIENTFLGEKGVVSILKQNLYLSAYASPGHFNDMDMMQIGRRTFTVDEEKSHFGLWCILSSPILIGCDLRTIPTSTLDIITNNEVLAVHQDVLGLQAKVVSKGETHVVLAKPLEHAYGTIRAVALFNWGEEASKLRVNFSDIQLGGEVNIRDLFTHTELGKHRDCFEAEVAPHALLLLRLDAEYTFERTVYDGQDAYLHDFTLVHAPREMARLVEFPGASSGVMIKYLGKSHTNWAEFRNVYSADGGTYQLTIEYYAGGGSERRLDVIVNGIHQHSFPSLKGHNLSRVRYTKPFLITLRQGVNVIRLTSVDKRKWAPDINRLRLKKIGEENVKKNIDL